MLAGLHSVCCAQFQAIAQRVGKGHAHLLRIRKTHMTEKTTAPKAKKPRKPARRATAQIPNFDELPDSALVRQTQLVRDPKHPTRPAVLPFSAATLWRKVREQSFPAPTKLSAAISAWRVSDVRQWLQAQAQA